jgi:hypothetical protein
MRGATFFVVVVSLAAAGCGGDSESFTISGTLSKSGVADGTYGYVKLVASGGAATAPALYWGRAPFSGGKASYSVPGIASGTYSGWGFIDVNKDAAGDGSSQPDAGDWATSTSQTISMTADQVVDLPEVAWTTL